MRLSPLTPRMYATIMYGLRCTSPIEIDPYSDLYDPTMGDYSTKYFPLYRNKLM